MAISKVITVEVLSFSASLVWSLAWIRPKSSPVPTNAESWLSLRVAKSAKWVKWLQEQSVWVWFVLINVQPSSDQFSSRKSQKTQNLSTLSELGWLLLKCWKVILTMGDLTELFWRFFFKNAAEIIRESRARDCCCCFWDSVIDPRSCWSASDNNLWRLA